LLALKSLVIRRTQGAEYRQVCTKSSEGKTSCFLKFMSLEEIEFEREGVANASISYYLIGVASASISYYLTMAVITSMIFLFAWVDLITEWKNPRRMTNLKKNLQVLETRSCI
jgi:hypothetical protein